MITAQPVKKLKLTDAVAEELLALIQRGDIKAGERLPTERALAEQMGVSRASLRDAIARLEVLGHLEARQGNGLYVREPSAANLTQPFQGILSRSPQSVQDILEFRLMIEPEVAAAAALRRSDEQLTQLRASLERQHLAATQRQKLSAEDLYFHQLIAQMSGNAIVTHILDTVQHLLHQLRQDVLLGNRPDSTLHEHGDIVRAIAERSPEQARAAVITHLHHVQQKSNLAPLDALANT